jgi:hypothetical protein
VEYRSTVSAVVLQGTTGACIVGAVVVAVFGYLWPAGLLLLVGGYSAWLTWPICYRASINGRTINYRQLRGERRANVSDVVKISRRSYGEGGGTLYVIHLVDGERVAVDGRRGREFIDGLLRVSPAITLPKGW